MSDDKEVRQSRSVSCQEKMRRTCCGGEKREIDETRSTETLKGGGDTEETRLLRSRLRCAIDAFQTSKRSNKMAVCKLFDRTFGGSSVCRVLNEGTKIKDDDEMVDDVPEGSDVMPSWIVLLERKKSLQAMQSDRCVRVLVCTSSNRFSDVYGNVEFTLVYRFCERNVSGKGGGAKADRVGELPVPEIYADHALAHMANAGGMNDLLDNLEEHSKPRRLVDIVTFLRHFLSQPLHPCSACNAQFVNALRRQAMFGSIVKHYKPKYPQLFDASLDWVECGFVVDELREALDALGRVSSSPTISAAAAAAIRAKVLTTLVRREYEGVYSFPFFTDKICEMLCEEIANYERSGQTPVRPNSMNNYGLVLNFVGMRRTLDRLQRTVLEPLSKLLFPHILGARDDFAAHHSFVVKYKVGEDLGLDLHTDDSDVTFNVSLGKSFKGGGLTFCGMQNASSHRKFTLRYIHVKGRCVAHAGTRRHGADNISDGERVNLIVWNKSRFYRRSKKYELTRMQRHYRKEDGKPDAVCLSYTHDRDYSHFKSLPAEFVPHRPPWCPPKHAEYAGYESRGDAEIPGGGVEDLPEALRA